MNIHWTKEILKPHNSVGGKKKSRQNVCSSLRRRIYKAGHSFRASSEASLALTGASVFLVTWLWLFKFHFHKRQKIVFPKLKISFRLAQFAVIAGHLRFPRYFGTWGCLCTWDPKLHLRLMKTWRTVYQRPYKVLVLEIGTWMQCPLGPHVT